MWILIWLGLNLPSFYLFSNFHICFLFVLFHDSIFIFAIGLLAVTLLYYFSGCFGVYNIYFWLIIFSLQITVPHFIWSIQQCFHFTPPSHCVINLLHCYIWASLEVQTVKNLPPMRETCVRSLAWENPLEEGMATIPVFLPAESPGTEEPCGLQSMGLQSRIGLSD